MISPRNALTVTVLLQSDLGLGVHCIPPILKHVPTEEGIMDKNANNKAEIKHLDILIEEITKMINELAVFN